MNNKKFTFGILLTLLAFSQCHPKIKITDPEKIVTPTPPVDIKSDTITVCLVERETQDFTDTISYYSISHFPEKKLYTYKNLKKNRIEKELSYDSLGVTQVTRWKKGIIDERIFIERNRDGRILKIETHELKNDSLQLSKMEKYGYVNGSVSHLYYMDYEWHPTIKFLRETMISFNLDELGRKKSAIVKSKPEHMDKYYPRDTVRYFYKGNSKLPYKVHRKLENGAKYFITEESENVLKIEAHFPWEDKYLLRMEQFTFDKKNRVIEHIRRERFEPQESTRSFYKDVITYSDNSDVPYFPNLIYPNSTPFPQKNISSHIESIVNPGFHRDAKIRTDVDFNFSPKTINYYKSFNGESWIKYATLVLQ